MNRSFPSRGVCFGFEIHSHLPFQFLRADEGEPVEVSIEERLAPLPEETLVVEWKPREGRPFHGRVYQDERGRYRVWTSDAGWFLVDPVERSIVAQQGIDELRREVRLLTTPMLLLMVERGDLPLHASAVEIDGRAFLFGAPSRFGKTTMAAGFHAAGYRVLAEDVACVRFDGEALVVPGPALLRLRRDVAERLELDGLDPIGEDSDRLFLALDGERAGDAKALPLGGLVLLRGDATDVRLAQVTGPDLLRDLWALGFKLPTDADFRRCFDGLARLSGETDIWNLSFPRDLNRLSATVAALVAELG